MLPTGEKAFLGASLPASSGDFSERLTGVILSPFALTSSLLPTVLAQNVALGIRGYSEFSNASALHEFIGPFIVKILPLF